MPATVPETIERVEAPTREHFEEVYVNTRTPVILTGVATRWKASEWDADYLTRVAGDRDVTVHYDENGNFRDWYNTRVKQRPDRRMPLRELLGILTADPADRRYYMTEHALGDVSPNLLDDLSMSDYIVDRLTPGVSSGPCLFLGRDTCMPLHYHATTQAFMCQLYATKKVTLVAPEDTTHMYPRRWYQDAFVFSNIDGETQRTLAEQPAEKDFTQYPKLAGARLIEFTVHPGEVLFIPVHWWHLTTASGFQISMTYFWQHKAAPRCYPQPGLQVLARETFINAPRRVRNAVVGWLGRTPRARVGEYD